MATLKRAKGVRIIKSTGKNGARHKKVHQIGTVFDDEGGKYEYEPSPELKLLVMRMIQVGATIASILVATKIASTRTLYKHYRDEIETGRELLKIQALNVVVDEMEMGNLDAAKFVLTRAGWGEPVTTKVELTGKDGGAIETRQTRDLTDEELAIELAKYGINELPKA